MGLMVVVVPSDTQLVVDLAATDQLAQLGVTSMSVTRDAQGHAVVLEGWAFDPERSGEEVAALVTGSAPAGRSMPRVMHLAIGQSRSTTERPIKSAANA